MRSSQQLLVILMMLTVGSLTAACKRDRAAAERQAIAAGRIAPESSSSSEEEHKPPAPEEVDESVHYHWTLQVGGPGEEEVSACDAAEGPTVLVAGTFDQSLHLGNQQLESRGGDDIFVARISAEGKVLNVFQAGGPGDETVVDVRQIQSGVLIAGSFEGETLSGLDGNSALTSAGKRDGFVSLLSSDLTAVVWSTAVGGTGTDEVLDLAASNGSVVVAGYSTEGFEGLESPDRRAHGFVARIDPQTGIRDWTVGVRGGSSDKAESVDLAPDGTVVVGGYFKKQLRVAGQEIEGIGHRDIFVLGLDPEGGYRWGRAVGGDGWDDVEAVRWIADGILVAGFAKGNLSTDEGTVELQERSAFAALLNPDGSALWVKPFPSSQPSAIKALAPNPETAVLIGEFQGTLDAGGGQMKSRAGSIDVFVTGLDMASGAFQWSSWLGGNGHESLHCGTRLGRDVVVAGFFEGELDLGTSVLHATAGHDGFVAAIEPRLPARTDSDSQGSKPK